MEQFIVIATVYNTCVSAHVTTDNDRDAAIKAAAQLRGFDPGSESVTIEAVYHISAGATVQLI